MTDWKNWKKSYYRGIDRRRVDAEFRELLRREFPGVDPDRLDGFSRRRFMQLLGASAALAAAAGCRWEDDRVLTFNERPANRMPGVPQRFATALELRGVAEPLLMTVYDGRPIKTEGNPDHPMSGGAASLQAQALVLSMYDPDRSDAAVDRRGGEAKKSGFDAFFAAERDRFVRLRSARGRGLHFLAGASWSPTLLDLRERLARELPEARWHEWEAVSDDEIREGTRLAFGKPYRPQLRLERADVVLALDHDFLGDPSVTIPHTRAFSRRRDPENGDMNRLYCVESAFTVTGTMADHRLPLRADLVGALVSALAAELGIEGASGASTVMANERIARFVRAVAKDLARHKGHSLVTIGRHQPAAVHAHVHRINAWLGNIGETIVFLPEPGPDRPRHLDDIGELTQSMRAGAVDTLVLLDRNPVYDAPADLDFAAALDTVDCSIHLGLYRDETARRCTWHLPMAHPLESWADARAWDGSWIVVQPTIAPLFGGRTAAELVAAVLLDEVTEGYDLVRRTFDDKVSTDEHVWRKTLHDGVLADSAPATVKPEPASKLPPMPAAKTFARDEVENGGLELRFVADRKVIDGRFANNGWLQELPDPITRLTWDNVALLGPATADALGVRTGDVVRLVIGERSLEIAAYVLPGHAPGSVTVAMGYGRTHAGVVGGSKDDDVDPVGFDAFRLRTTEAPWFSDGLRVEKTGRTYPLAMVQDHHMMDTVGMEGREERLPLIVREGTLEEYRERPDFVREVEEGPSLKSLWEEHPYEGHRWGMAIDLGKCTGCSACVVACHAENNIPVVGKQHVGEGREMQWLRVDHYFSGDVEDPSVVAQPIPCQQCEHAPCEEVCPVGATMHSEEGLNDMVYNRCIGTRYCSNNCPYKVRRFNFFNYHLDLDERENELKKMAFNPDVTIRARGVMEKCTFCVQRITAVRIAAKNEKRPIRDGEIVPACAQTCPAEAITFGDLNDPEARVLRDHDNPRAYALLSFLNVRPRTAYLARIRNPNPELADGEPAEAH